MCFQISKKNQPQNFNPSSNDSRSRYYLAKSSEQIPKKAVSINVKTYGGKYEMDDSINKTRIVDEIIKTLSNKDKVTQFLKENEISDIDTINDIQQYEREDSRKGLILKVKETNNSGLIKIMIDIRSGQPSIDQVYDAVYELGADFSKRVIMYTGGKSGGDDHNPTVGPYLVESLAGAMNEYPLGLYLVKKSESIISKGLTDFTVIAQPHGVLKFQMKDLPSKLQFREVEFWRVYFWSSYEGIYRPWEAFSDGFIDRFNYGFWMPINNLRIAVRWTKEGAYFTVTQTNDDYHALKEIWIEKENELRKIFDGNDIELVKDHGKLSKLIIKYWEFTSTVLLNATPDEKKDYAESIYRKFCTLVGII